MNGRYVSEKDNTEQRRINQEVLGRSRSSLSYSKRRRGTPGGGSGGGGSALRTGRVYTDLAGAQVDSEGRVNVPTVTCLYERDAAGGGYEADTEGEPFEAEPVFGMALSLASEGCCGSGDGGGSVPAGLRLDHLGFVSDGASVAITGSGVYANSNVEISVSDGTTIKTQPATVSAAGTFAATFDFTAPTALVRGPLKVTGTETTIESVVQSSRSLVTVYDPAPDPAVTLDVLKEPPRPDLTDASDTGASSSDNLTTDDTPTATISKAAGEVSQSASGPFPQLYVDGVMVAEDTNTSALDSGSIDLTSPPLANGLHSLQAVLYLEGTGSPPPRNYGPSSPPLYVTVDPGADGTEQPTDTRYFRRCLIDGSAAPPRITQIDSCRWPMSSAEITAIDGEPAP